jgi:tetratricopeptide (TPR) repeat protein
MASIYIYNKSRGKCVELNSPAIAEEDIAKLKSALPTNLEGISFSSPMEEFEEQTPTELRVEDRARHVAEYLKSIGNKLEELQQIPGALGFYDLAFRLSKNSDVLMMKARVLTKHGQVDQAQRLLNHYVKKHPENPESYFMFGKLALSRADYAQAQFYFQEAQSRIRANNVEHKPLQETLDVYDRFVAIYIDRDQLFTRDLPTAECAQEISKLKQRTQDLMQTLQANPKPELQGMVFFLETQDKIFEKWLEEMTA